MAGGHGGGRGDVAATAAALTAGDAVAAGRVVAPGQVGRVGWSVDRWLVTVQRGR